MSGASKQIVVSGIRATGQMHIGNYLGAVQNFVRMGQDPNLDCYFFVANLHTITTRPPGEELKRDLRLVVTEFLAAGLDPERVTIYAQSSIPETTELAWILACMTPVGDLMRMHHFKEKKGNLDTEGMNANAGLLTYPVLMAADILGPRADWVPVGNDQKQHVEMARDLAERFNRQYGDVFPMPNLPLSTGDGIRIPSLTGDGKMGKSNPDGTLMLTDDADAVRKKLLKGVTDTQRVRRHDPGDPLQCGIFTFHQHLSSDEVISHVMQGCKSAGIGCFECKALVAENANRILEPIRERRAQILALGDRYIDEVLHQGGTRARVRIKETVDRVKDVVGVPTY